MSNFPNLRLGRSRSLSRWLLAGALGLAVAAAVLVWARTDITTSSYRLRQLRQDSTALRTEVERLRIEAAALLAPEQLETHALQLGMRHPIDGQIVYLGRSALPAVASAGHADRSTESTTGRGGAR